MPAPDFTTKDWDDIFTYDSVTKDYWKSRAKKAEELLADIAAQLQSKGGYDIHPVVKDIRLLLIDVEIEDARTGDSA